jgi:hypothetical protein
LSDTQPDNLGRDVDQLQQRVDGALFNSETPPTADEIIGEEQRARERNHPYKRPLGQPGADGEYREMPLANPKPKEEFGEEFSGDRDGLRKAAAEVFERRVQEQQEPLLREYQELGGQRRGQPVQPSSTVTSEQAAWDLQTARQAEVQEELDKVTEQLRNQIDGEQGTPAPENLGVASEETSIQETPQPAAVDPNAEIMAELERSPKLAAALQEHNSTRR